MKIDETIMLLNNWWKEDKISQELAKPYKRMVFDKVLKLADLRQITILSGLRRVGKTTIMYQMIEYFLKKEKAEKILYFNFDKNIKEINNILESYSELTEINWKKEKIYVFLDEISKLDEWAGKIKLIYDAYPNIKFMISSSSSVTLEEDAMKNLGGRYFMVNIKPLNFTEYLELKNNKELVKNPNLYKKEIKKEFKDYLLRSFPETINWKDELLIKDYLKTTLIDKIIKSDLSDRFKNINKDLLYNLLEIFFSEPGFYIDYDNLSKKLHVSKKTLIEHIFYLEFSYLIRRIKNFRPSIYTASRKMQRVYCYWWNFAYCYSDNEDKIMENLIASTLDSKYYWNKNKKEVDFLIVDKAKKKIIPIEVKNKKELSKKDTENLKYFLNKHNIKEGIVIYNGEEEKIKINENRRIILKPIWKWLLEETKEK